MNYEVGQNEQGPLLAPRCFSFRQAVEQYYMYLLLQEASCLIHLRSQGYDESGMLRPLCRWPEDLKQMRGRYPRMTCK